MLSEPHVKSDEELAGGPTGMKLTGPPKKNNNVIDSTKHHPSKKIPIGPVFGSAAQFLVALFVVQGSFDSREATCGVCC